MKKSTLYFAYNRFIRSEFDLTAVGLKPVKSKLPFNYKPLTISNMGRLGFDRDYVNNQTMVNTSDGYYYKENIGFFEFVSGDEIKVSIDYHEFDTDFVRTLLNYPISCVFYQKDIFSLHASAVIFRGKVIIFPGSALTGKSSIAAYFLKNGGRLITEDTAVLEILNNRAYVRSSYPFIKLSESANTELSFSSYRGISLQTDTNKRRGFLLNENSFLGKLVPADYCVFLEYGDRESVEPFSLSEAALKLLSLSLNIYPMTVLKQKKLFHWSADLARCLKIFRFRRRKGILLSRFLAEFLTQNNF